MQYLSKGEYMYVHAMINAQGLQIWPSLGPYAIEKPSYFQLLNLKILIENTYDIGVNSE